MTSKHANVDDAVVKDFGAEWKRFDQRQLTTAERSAIFEDYFRIFPWEKLRLGAVGADIGCGSGRWAVLVAPRVGQLHLVDPSESALVIARGNLSHAENVVFHQASADSLPFDRECLDFAYSLGVLHHVPDTNAAICSIARVLRPGAPFLIYLYYAFDHRPWWFRALDKLSEAFRLAISRMPLSAKSIACDVIALLVYLPLSRTALLLDRIGLLPGSWPLSYYRNLGFYVMRTDARDKFGTRLVKRFRRNEIETMLKSAGFTDIHFSETQPYWCAVGVKQS